MQTARMKQPNQQQLRALRLTALARDSQVVADLNASIADTPDSLVKELMDTHGWPAHEALSAVQQLQEKALRDTYEQAAVRAAQALKWIRPASQPSPDALS